MQEDSNGEPCRTPFTLEEFSSLSDKIASLKPLDLSDERIKDAIKFKRQVPIENVKKINDKTIFGQYKASYWGHAYENTDVGKIPADSISLRPFYFLIYLSDSGKIYIATQYLGRFGSYGGIKSTICSMLSESKNIQAFSFRSDSATYGDVVPKEVRVQIARKHSDIASGNVFDSGALITFKKQSRGDDFAGEVKRRLFPRIGGAKENIQKAVSEILKQGKLVSVNDDDIEDCTIIGDVNGQRKMIYLIGDGSYASQFAINVTFNSDGHPEAAPTEKAMIELLTTQIIDKSEP